MNNRSSKIARLVSVSLALLMAAVSSNALAQKRLQALFTEMASPGEGIAAEPHLVRARHVSVDFSQLKSGQLLLNLFPDVTLQAQRDGKLATQSRGRQGWTGTIVGDPNSAVTLITDGTILTGSVTTGSGQSFQIRYSGSAHVIREVDPSLYPSESEPLSVILPGRPAAGFVGGGTEGAAATIDLMVVYSPSARIGAGGTGGMESLIDLMVSETNQAYGNSAVGQSVRLVHTAELAYPESGNLQTDLERLQEPGDGFLDEVHALRNTHAADLVMLLVEDGNFCGIAYVMQNVSSTFEEFGFSVTVRNCGAAPQYTFPHELGHNMSARHDWFVDDTANSPFSYNHGYVDWDENQLWRTIMAANAHCAYYLRFCPRIAHFSNPDVRYNNRPTGTTIRDETDCEAGNVVLNACDAHNAMALNQTASVVAGFRTAGPPDAPPNAVFESLCDGLECAFDATASSDDNGIVSYAWTFGDGTSATGANTANTYPQDGTYSVTLTVTDTAGQTDQATSTVTVIESCGDTVRPNVSLTAPTGGERIWGQYTLRANASDNVGVTQVRFRINGSTVCTDHSYPWQCTTNLDGYATNNYTFTAQAFDACGNVRTSSGVIARIVSNPEMAIDLPADGAAVSGENVGIVGWASDPDGVTSVAITLDGQAMVPPTYGGSRPDVCQVVQVDDPNCPNVGFGTTFNSTHYSNGTHNIEVVATDASGKTSTRSRSFVIDNPAPAPCQPGPETLCLRDGRFKVEVTNVNGGASSDAKARPYSDKSGFFWFFGPDNLEAGVKILGPGSNGYWWVYHGAATDREYTLAVTDTQTGDVRTYVKPFGSFCGDPDTQGFPAGSSVAKLDFPPMTGKVGNCSASSTGLCLQEDRFRVEVLRSGVPQPAHALTDETGTFSFFSADNAEVFVKVLDGTGFNGHYWVFYGSMTDRDFTIRVTDTATDEVVTYTNNLGNYCGNGDTTAFPAQ